MFVSAFPHLYARFCESNAQSQFLSHEDVGVMGLGEAAFEFVQLRRREAGAMTLLFLHVLVSGILPSALTSGAGQVLDLVVVVLDLVNGIVMVMGLVA